MSIISPENVTGISVFCKTPHLIDDAYSSFRKFYPKNPLIISNGLAGDETTRILKLLEVSDNNLSVLCFEENIGHGPGMHDALLKTGTPAAYIFDSDTRIDFPVIEPMLQAINKPLWYAIGSLGAVNNAGFAGKPDSAIPYIHPAIMMVNVAEYLQYHPFIDHGAPLLKTMIDISSKGHSEKLIHFPVRKYVWHGWKGTRNITGKYK